MAVSLPRALADLLKTLWRREYRLKAALSVVALLGIVVELWPIANRLSDILYNVLYMHSSSVVAWIQHFVQTVEAQDAPLKPYQPYISAFLEWVDKYGGGITAAATVGLALATRRLVATTVALHRKAEERRAKAEEDARRDAQQRSDVVRMAEDRARAVVVLYDRLGNPLRMGLPPIASARRPGPQVPTAEPGPR